MSGKDHVYTGLPHTSPKAHDTEELDFSSVPSIAEEKWSTGSEQIHHNEPGWAQSSSSVKSVADNVSSYVPVRKKNRATAFVVISVIALLFGTAAYLFLFQRELLLNQFGQVQDSKMEERQATLLLEAREKVLLDTSSDFAQAEKKYLKVLSIQKDNADALAQLAHLYAIWAQHLNDNYLDARNDESESRKEGSPTEAPSAEIENLDLSFKSRLADARIKAQQALSIAPNHPEANLAMAEVALMEGKVEMAKSHLEKGRAAENNQDASYVSALIGIAEGKNEAEIIGMLKSIVVSEPRLRVLYRLARVQLAAGRNDEAQKSISRILQLNSKHIAALELKQRIADNKSVALIRVIPPDDGAEDSEVATPTQPEEPKQVVSHNNSVEDVSERAANHENGESVSSMRPDQLLRKAAAAHRSGNPAEAVTLFNQVLESDPNNIEALNGLGYAYIDMGSRGQAIAKFKRALDINSSFGPAQIGMAQTYKFMGQNRESLNWFEKYLASNPSGRQAAMAQRNIDELKSTIEAQSTKGESDVSSSPASDAPPSGTGSNEVKTGADGTTGESGSNRPSGNSPPAESAEEQVPTPPPAEPSTQRAPVSNIAEPVPGAPIDSAN
ncbi:MAG: tetratricopeptide repeat protein [Deltaproteobacteria bacterium]|nr:tetratricopeptide repeat protein [Deltaproteobacteria bacterium]